MRLSLTVGTEGLSLGIGSWTVESSIRFSHLQITRGEKGLLWMRAHRCIILDDFAFGSFSEGFEHYY